MHSIAICLVHGNQKGLLVIIYIQMRVYSRFKIISRASLTLIVLFNRVYSYNWALSVGAESVFALARVYAPVCNIFGNNGGNISSLRWLDKRLTHSWMQVSSIRNHTQYAVEYTTDWLSCMCVFWLHICITYYFRYCTKHGKTCTPERPSEITSRNVLTHATSQHTQFDPPPPHNSKGCIFLTISWNVSTKRVCASHLRTKMPRAHSRTCDQTQQKKKLNVTTRSRNCVVNLIHL